MNVNRQKLLNEARDIRDTLKDLSDHEINVAVLEVLKCHAPFISSTDLDHILIESRYPVPESV